ncbi:MAG: NitT/TauT family transport system ATP-binding protein [Frankiaceae bacterium]|jgi:NitT/TauT family transport system ATP-binding protein|nr:NitT/TauT family transport system ATP-binding protein [Frankiaceae bacterium]
MTTSQVAGVEAARLSRVDMTFPDGTRAIESLSLSIAPGEFVSIVGPSGCGKSTVLRLLAGLETPTAGDVLTGGGGLGYVFQDATLLPWRNVLANIELPALLEGVSRGERRNRARRCVEQVGLGGFERHRPAQLSGGMKMRVSIARALMLTPQLFLFDEPFGALDEITRERLNEELASLFRLQSFAAVFVTHSVNEAVFLSTRVIVMSPRPGRIVADIPVPFDYPRSPQLRYDAAFTAVAGHVSAALREATAAVA